MFIVVILPLKRFMKSEVSVGYLVDLSKLFDAAAPGFVIWLVSFFAFIECRELFFVIESYIGKFELARIGVLYIPGGFYDWYTLLLSISESGPPTFNGRAT